MEYHFVPLEERARDEKGNILPWGYVYKELVVYHFDFQLCSLSIFNACALASLAIHDDNPKKLVLLVKGETLVTIALDPALVPARLLRRRTLMSQSSVDCLRSSRKRRKLAVPFPSRHHLLA